MNEDFSALSGGIKAAAFGTRLPPDLYSFKQALLRPGLEGDQMRKAPHLKALDHMYDQLLRYYETRGRSGIGKLVVSMPRRYGKSLDTGIFGAYFLARNPDARLIVACYGEELAKSLSGSIRSFVEHKNNPYKNARVDKKKSAILAWDLEDEYGGLTGHGIEAGATGLGFSCLLVDDIMRSSRDAASELKRESIWNELRASFLNGRDYPWSVVAIIGTRWHTDDPISRVVDLWGDECYQLVLPLLIEEEQVIKDQDGLEIFRRSPDEPLFAWKHDLEASYKIRDTEAPHLFAAQWQQEPVDALGTFFLREWFEIVGPHELPVMETVVRGWDLAYMNTPTADWSVGVKIGRGVDGRFYIMDVNRSKQDHYGRDLERHLVQVFEADGPDVPQLIEDAGIAKEFIKELNASPELMGHFVGGIGTESRQKWERALPVQAKLSSGVLRLLRGDWNQDFINELCSFMPDMKAQTDDQVDATSVAWAGLEQHVLNHGYNSWESSGGYDRY